MMKKIFIVGLIVCSFFVVSISSVTAIKETRTIEDPSGDVFDYLSNEFVTYSPNIDVDNIDITKITYSRQDKFVTLTLQVKGNIENKGNISDLESDVADIVAYTLLIYSVNDSYTINYVNKICQIKYESQEETKNVTALNFPVSKNILTINFNLLNDNELYDTIYSEASYYKVTETSEFVYLYDAAPDLTEFNVTIDAPTKGEVGQPIQFSGSESGGQSPITWSWDFGDGGTANTLNAMHSYDAAGDYQVYLYATDVNGNSGTAIFNITISESGTNDGGNNGGNTDGKSSNSGLILFAVIIAIVVIVGVVVVVYIIRR